MSETRQDVIIEDTFVRKHDLDVKNTDDIEALQMEIKEKINLKEREHSKEETKSDVSCHSNDKEVDKFDHLTTKLLEGAYSIGSSIYSAGTKMLQQGIFGEFSKEQNYFINNKNMNLALDLAPWEGLENEETLKEQCLNLSSDYSNFLRSPPVGNDFQFDYELSYPIANAMIKHDPRLEQVRYDLVPKQISEANFWRNYFYRIDLLVQAYGSKNSSRKRQCEGTSESDTQDESWLTELEVELEDYGE